MGLVHGFTGMRGGTGFARDTHSGDMELGRFHPWHAAPIHSTYNENDDNNFPLLYVLAFAMACTFADWDAVGDMRWGWGCKKKKLASLMRVV